MLLYFSVENFKCFASQAELNLTATREQHHGERLARLSRRRVVPVAAIYGANASGKSTLVAALEALREVIVAPRGPRDRLPLTPNFALMVDDVVAMSAEILVPVGGSEAVFLYELEASSTQVMGERLIRVGSTTETYLFERTAARGPVLYGELEDDERAQAFARVLDQNQTLLGLLGPRMDGEIGAVWDWFAHRLQIIHPGSRYIPLPERFTREAVFASAMNRGLTRADTGITRLEMQRIPLDAVGLGGDEDSVRNQLAVDGGSVVAVTLDGDPVILTLDDKETLVAERLVSVHEEDGTSFRLSLAQESDGTRRFMHLLPLLFQLSDADNRGVFVIDELENSLHPRLTEDLIATFLADLDGDSRRQLIFTTHEVTLMRADILRRDEMWLAQRHGSDSTLTRLADFAGIGARKNADIYRMYMSGRLGGVPQI